MRVFVMTDAESRITGVNPNDMSGNSGWIETTDTALTAHTGVSYDDMFSRLSEEHGVSLYKFMDGYGEHRTAEEIAADIAAIPPPQPSEIEQLRTRVVELEGVIDALIGGGTNE